MGIPTGPPSRLDEGEGLPWIAMDYSFNSTSVYHYSINTQVSSCKCTYTGSTITTLTHCTYYASQAIPLSYICLLNLSFVKRNIVI